VSLALVTAYAVRATGRNPSPFDAAVTRHYEDLLAQFGLAVDARCLAHARNVGYAELAEAVLDGLGAEPADLILFAYAIPDLPTRTTAAAQVNHRLGGRAWSMAISEQGLRAPYTALRLADACHRGGRCRRALVFVLEQTTLPYHDPLVHDTPLSDTAVGLVLAAADGGRIGRPWSGPASQLAAMIDGSEGEDTLVVAGPWVTANRASDLHRCASGTYCTSVWLALAENYQRWRRRYPSVLLCDVDPRTGGAHALRVEFPRAGPVR
jgi:hypothetical protein